MQTTTFILTLTLVITCDSDVFQATAQALALCSVARPGSIMHSDAARAFINAANKYGMIHLLCSKHWHKKVEQLSTTLGKQYKEFKKGVMSLIYEEFADAAQFEICLKKLLDDFRENGDAIKVLNEVNKDRNSLCATFTRQYYTAGHRSTQRIEGWFGGFKRGKSKAKMRRWTFTELLKCLLDIIARYQQKARGTLQQLLRQGKICCDSAEKAWITENNNSGSCVASRVDTSGVFDVDGSNRVQLPDRLSINPNEYGTCTCSYHTSTLLPCRHICKALSSDNTDIFDINLLHPRWRLINHPCYKGAMNDLHLLIPINTPFFAPSRLVIEGHVDEVADATGNGEDNERGLRNDYNSQIPLINFTGMAQNVATMQATQLRQKREREDVRIPTNVNPSFDCAAEMQEMLLMCQSDGRVRTAALAMIRAFMDKWRSVSVPQSVRDAVANLNIPAGDIRDQPQSSLYHHATNRKRRRTTVAASVRNISPTQTSSTGIAETNPAMNTEIPPSQPREKNACSKCKARDGHNRSTCPQLATRDASTASMASVVIPSIN